MVLAFLVAAVPLGLMGVSVVSQGIAVVIDADWWTEPIPADVGRSDLAGNEELCDLGFGTRRVRSGGPVGQRHRARACSPRSSAPS